MTLRAVVKSELDPIDGDVERFAEELADRLQGEEWDVIHSENDETAYLVTWEVDDA